MNDKAQQSNSTAFIILERGQSEETMKVYPLSSAITVIGRPTSTSNPDIRINDPNISRNHVEIRSEGGSFFIIDSGSTNGSRVNGTMLEKDKPYELADKALIELAFIQGVPRAVLRFACAEGGVPTPPPPHHGESAQTPSWLTVDDGRKEVLVDNNAVVLSRKEYSLLWFLYRRAGTICSRDEIIAEVWPDARDPGAVSDATIDQLVHRLREKVEPDPSNPVRIVSKKSFGYMLV